MLHNPRPLAARAASLALTLGLLACNDADPTPADGGSSDGSTSTAESEPGTTAQLDTSGGGSGSSSDETGEDSELPFEPAGPDAAPDPSVMGPYPVGVRTVELLDQERPDDDGNPRRLVTEIWYPAVEEARGQPGYVYTVDDLLTEEARALLKSELEAQLPTDAVRDATPRDDGDRFPVVAFSHGSSGVRMQSTYFTVFLASHGYVVASPDHAGNTLSDAIILDGDITQAQLESLSLRPDDIAYAIEFLQELGDADPLGAIVDGERVGVSGHSFGALTTLRMLGQDRPIDAAVAMTPPGYELVWFGALPNEPGDIDVPVMIQAGGLDMTTPLADAESIWTLMTSPRSLLTVHEAGHFSFSDMCLLDPMALAEATSLGLLDALNDGCGEDNLETEQALPLQRHFAVGLFNGHLRQSPGSLELLTVEAADALAPGQFEFIYEP